MPVGGSVIKDVSLLLAFWGLVLAPCLLAMKTGLHKSGDYEPRREA